MTDPYGGLATGDELVYESVSYFFTTRTPDARMMAISSQNAVLMMPDPITGFPAFPTRDMLRTAHRERRLFFRSPRLQDPVRAQARDEEATPDEIEERDGRAALRRMTLRAWDREPADAKPMRSDAGLRAWFADRFDLKEVEARFGRAPAASTIREWINHRGRPNDRRAVDMENRSGKVPRARRCDERIIALGRLHALAGTARARTKQLVSYARFKRDVRRMNAGQPIEIDGVAFEYEPPRSKLRPYSAETFRKEWWAARNADSVRASSGTKAASQHFGGGGRAKEPTRILEIVEGDDTPFPSYFLIDPYNRVPVGQPTVVLNVDVLSQTILGWDMSFDPPSTPTWMRSVLHVSEPKEVPERLREQFPGLADLHGYVSGCYLFDNALQNIARAVEDAGGDLCHEVRIAGEGEPTHKPLVERVIRTMQTYMAETPGSSFDIQNMRRYDYNPERHVVLTIEEFRTLLAEAIATYHVTPNEGLDGRTPLDVWQEQIALHGQRIAHDQDQFIRSIGSVGVATFTRSGVEFEGLRYTAGDNAALLADMAAALGPPENLQAVSYRVKIKTYDDDLGYISVFNPLTRRYEHLSCSTPRYADGLPLWLHRRIRQFAADKRMAFATEEQMEEARIGLSDVIAAISPQADARQRRVVARLLDKPATRRRLGSSLQFMRVKPSASGLENVDVVEHDLRIGTRRDAMTEPPRPPRGGVNITRESAEQVLDREAFEAIAAKAPPRHAKRKPAKPRRGDDRRPRPEPAADADAPMFKPLPSRPFS